MDYLFGKLRSGGEPLVTVLILNLYSPFRAPAVFLMKLISIGMPLIRRHFFSLKALPVFIAPTFVPKLFCGFSLNSYVNCRKH